MRKRQALLLFAALAVGVLSVSAGLHLVLAASGLAWLGWAVDVFAALTVVDVSIGCFSRNSPVFGGVLCGRRLDAPLIALTFDDGPSPDITPRILDALRKADARATFFVLGKHARHHPEILARIVREGHEVASHGWSHGLLVFSRPATLRRELEKTAALLNDQGVPQPRFFRTPHGFRGPLTSIVAARLGYQVAGWSAGVFDTALPGADVIIERSLRALRPGAILLLHDADGNGDENRSQTADALPGILDAISARGLLSVTVSELAIAAPRRELAWRWIVAFVGVTIVVGLLLARTNVEDWRVSVRVFAGLDLGLVTAAILANLASIGLKATVWQAALQSLPSRPHIAYRHVVAATFVGFLMNSILLARLGEAARAIVLRRRIGRESGEYIPLATVAGTVVAESLVLGATLLLLMVVTMVTASSLPPELRAGIGALLAILALTVAGVVILRIWTRMHSSPSRGPATTPTRRRRLVGRLERLTQEFSHGQRLFRSPGRIAYAGTAGLGSWMANLLAIWFTALAFGIHPHAFAAAVVVFAVSNLVGVVQVTPGNIGVFQIAIAASLTRAFGVDNALGLSFALGLQVIEMSLGVGLGLLCLARENLSLATLRADSQAVVAARVLPGNGFDAV